MNVVKPETINTTGSITRASTGTYFDISGTMQTAAIDAIRINYNPITHEFLGVLIENASTNLLTYSEQFDNIAWVKTGISVTANASTTPAGTLTAEKLVENVTLSVKQVGQTISVTTGTSYTFTVFAKSDGSNRELVIIFENGFGTGWNDSFNLATGMVSANQTGNAKITAVGGGWYKCEVTRVCLSSGSASFSYRIRNPAAPDTLTYTGDGTSGIYIWGAQLELGSVATSYIPTVASQATRAADIISGSGLVYTNAVNTYAEWSSATTYALGTTVSYGSAGTYVSLQNSNLNQNPITATTYWTRSGPTNKMAAFDDIISSSTTSTSDIIFAVTASSIDTVALLNLVGSRASIAVSDVTLKTLVYHNYQPLLGDTSVDWYSYFFYDADTVRTMSTYLDIPSSANMLITVKISGTGTVSIGNYLAGTIKELGATQYGASAGIIDYSKKEVDAFGNITFVKRNYSKRINANISLTNANLNRVQRILYQIRATPALWIASTDLEFEEPLIVYGFYKDFSTEISYPTHSICNLQIEGLI